jgi:hypothetical protein
MVARKVVIDPSVECYGAELIPVGDLWIGDPSSTEGFRMYGGDVYDYAWGVVQVGSESVVAMDADMAEVPYANFAGGMMSSAHGINIPEYGEFAGGGTVDCNLTLSWDGGDIASLLGNSEEDPLVVTGTLRGNCYLEYVDPQGLYSPGFSPSRSYYGRGTFSGTVDSDVAGTTDYHWVPAGGGQKAEGGEFDQFYVTYQEGDVGVTTIDQVFQLDIEESYVPADGDRITLIRTGYYLKPPAGVQHVPGVIEYGDAFEVEWSANSVTFFAGLSMSPPDITLIKRTDNGRTVGFGDPTGRGWTMDDPIMLGPEKGEVSFDVIEGDIIWVDPVGDKTIGYDYEVQEGSPDILAVVLPDELLLLDPKVFDVYLDYLGGGDSLATLDADDATVDILDMFTFDEGTRKFQLMGIDPANDDPFIVGLGYAGSGPVTLLVTPIEIPEPGMLILLATGGLALLLWRRRRGS